MQSALQFYVSERGFLDKFAINGAGEVLLRRALDYEAADTYHYQVMVTDGVSVSSRHCTLRSVLRFFSRFE